MADYGTIEYKGKTYTLDEQADFTNRLMEHPDLVEFSAIAHDENNDEYIVYWIFDMTDYDWDNVELDELDWSNESIDRVEQV